ncbi:cytochrome P450 2K1 isoform X1 [Microcaecilia unicolor]|uniref:Cytochrome P450 2K1-like isoform X1 n=1 Tax=Microcaecilia unicolor TaxID=1415580 RepID=A0A6P7XPY5_9AMPH|nr:cytochrome P450 2K1-like isoform X1 [Microcaecilia unicolor]
MCFSVLTILFLVGVITLICYISGVNVWKRNIQQNFPPGPRPLPLIGNLHIMNLKRPHKTLCKLSEKYGSVFSIQMGMKKMVILTGYETVKEALVSHADVFEERAIIPVFEDVAKGHGIIFSHGETWKVMRKFTMKTLRDFGMGKRTIEDKIIEECGFLINHFESFHGTPFDTLMSITLPVANIIASILQGYRFDYNDPVLRRLIHLNDKADRLLGSPMVSLYNIFPILGFLPGNHKVVQNILMESQGYIKSILIESRKQLDTNVQRSFIDAFLSRQKEEKDNPNTYFNEDNLVNLVQNLLGAGMGTTSTTIRWSLLIMMKYPKIQEKVQEEIERVIGSSQPRAEHWKLMPYTNAVIHEVQRFANIVPMNLPHETTRDINFKGYFLPKGTFIVPLLESVLRDKTYFENPEEFKPQHFLDSGGKFVRKDAFMPFSAGRRVCAGETLAKMELFLFFISLLQKFTICLPPGVTDVDLMPAIGLATRPMPHLICALPRS